MGFISTVTVVPNWLWLAFCGGVLTLLVIDLGLFARAGKISRKMAILESLGWISISLLFAAGFTYVYGMNLGLEFITGYLVEESLSVDNLFVILLIFKSLRVPDKYQHRVLFYGILGAILLRGIFILAGATLVHKFQWVMYIFGAILVFTAVKFLRDSDDEVDPEKHLAVRLLGRFIPITAHFNGNHFFSIENGKRKATPLLVALIVVEATDLVFAVDSIPAVFSVTQDAFVAFGSNILAVLGLRSLYFVIADLVSSLRYLKPGLAAILGFIGVKMLIMDLFHIPSWVSLVVIVSILLTAGLSSWYVARLEESKKSQG